MWGVAPNWAGDEPTRQRKRGGLDSRPRVATQSLTTWSNSDYWLADVSTTFHGRDVFAPVAAHLAAAPSLSGWASRSARQPREVARRRASRTPLGQDNTVTGQIVHVDRFGNIITNLPERLLAPLLEGAASVSVEIAGYSINGLAGRYADVREGQPLALIGSENLLEIAIRNSNAAHRMKVRIGDAVRLVVASSEGLAS